MRSVLPNRLGPVVSDWEAVRSWCKGTGRRTGDAPHRNLQGVAMLERGAFLKKFCLAGQPVCTATATAMEDSTLVRLHKDDMIRALHEELVFAVQFLSDLLARTIRIQEDLVDQLLHSSEKRLARTLLLPAHFEIDGQTEVVIPKMNQEVLTAMVGTTRSRVSVFLNRFRKRGHIDYNGYNGEVHVRSSLRKVLPHN